MDGFPWKLFLVGVVYYFICSTLLLNLIESYISIIGNPSREFSQTLPIAGKCDEVKYDFTQYIEGAKFDIVQSLKNFPLRSVVTLWALHTSVVLNCHWRKVRSLVVVMYNINLFICMALSLLTALIAFYANHMAEEMKYNCNHYCPRECGCLDPTAHGTCFSGTIWFVWSWPFAAISTLISNLPISVPALVWATIQGKSSINHMVAEIVAQRKVKGWRVKVQNEECVKICMMDMGKQGMIPRGVTITQIDPADGGAPRTRPNSLSMFDKGDVVYMSCAKMAHSTPDAEKESDSWKVAKLVGSLERDPEPQDVVTFKCKEVGGKVPAHMDKKTLMEIDMRGKTNLTVCGIVNAMEEVTWFPKPDTALHRNDRLLIVDEVDESETVREIWDRL